MTLSPALQYYFETNFLLLNDRFAVSGIEPFEAALAFLPVALVIALYYINFYKINAAKSTRVTIIKRTHSGGIVKDSQLMALEPGEIVVPNEIERRV